MKPIRIAYGRFMQETNAFSSVDTVKADFERTHFVEGKFLHKACQPNAWEVEGFLKNLELSGFVKATQHTAHRVEAIPLLSAWSISGGPLARDFFDDMCQNLLVHLEKAQPIDGLFLALHGALGVRDLEDPEAQLLERIKQEYPHLKIAVTYDLHGLMTRKKIDAVDIMCAYQTNPHYDMARVGEKAGRLLIQLLAGEIQPNSTWRSLPMMLGGGNTLSFLPPMRSIFQRAKALEKDPRVLACNVFTVHPYLTHPELGWSVQVITDNHPELADNIADELAERCWQVRHKQPPTFLTPEQMLQKVKDAKVARTLGSVAVCDTSDAVGAGGTGENTHLLKFMLERAQDYAVLYPLRAPNTIADIWDTPEGTSLSLEVGGQLQPEVNPAVAVEGVLKKKSETENFGKVVLLDLGHVQLVLTEGYAMPMKPSFYEDMGLDVKAADMVVVKNFFHFMLYYATKSRKNLFVKTHGITDFDRILELETTHPVYPKDEIEDWREVDRLRRGLAQKRPSQVTKVKTHKGNKAYYLAAGLVLACTLAGWWQYKKRT